MTRVLLTTCLGLSLAACATLKDAATPACHGPLRPANPHGSVLDGSATPPPPKTAHPQGAGCGGPR